VRVANTGTGVVRSVVLEPQGPPGVTARAAPSVVPSLAPGTSALATLTISGVPTARPAFLVIRASGRADSGAVTSLATLELATPDAPASIALVGNTRITDKSPADLEAVITNLTDAPLQVHLRADASDRVRRGKTAVVLVATVADPQGGARPISPHPGSWTSHCQRLTCCLSSLLSVPGRVSEPYAEFAHLSGWANRQLRGHVGVSALYGQSGRTLTTPSELLTLAGVTGHCDR
jgi:hypothetical protein